VSYHQGIYFTKRKLRYLRFVRATEGPDGNGHTFFTSVVWAEMKKAASYKVDICMNQDAVVQETQCKCGAGQGPTAHCQHVAAVLYGLTVFCQEGSMLTELTCTQVLQTFHRAKTFKGSPIKSSDLHNLRGRQDGLILDYRPRNMKHDRHRFRNTCNNFALQVFC